MEQLDHVFDRSVPKRSVLYNLPPAELGSHRQESLTSYLTRLARAHYVSPRDLIKRVFGERNEVVKKLADNTFYTRYGATVNGLGQHAKLIARVANELTSRSDLQVLTMLPWQSIIPEQSEGFIARHPRWCPMCFHAQLMDSGETYAPLVWALVPYRRCTLHHCLLEEICPNCGKTQAFIPRIADASICGHCHCSLARAAAASYPKNSAQQVEHSGGYEDVLEAMVGGQGSAMSMMSRDFVCGSLERIAANQFGGSRIRLCRDMGWNQWAINRWLDKGERMSLPKLLQLARRFDITVIDLATGRFDQETLRPHSVAEPVVVRAPRPMLTRQQRNRYLHELNHSLSQGVSPSSLREAGLPYGLGRSAMRYWFPDLCQRISTQGAQDRRRNAESTARDRARIVTEVVDALVQAGQHPARRKVDLELKKHGLALARPEVFQDYVRAARRQEQQAQNTE